MANTKSSTKAAKVGDAVDVERPCYVQLPDGTAVSANLRYTFQHEGRHVVDGVEYDVTK